MISFAAIAPHPPLLLPAIGKDKIEKIKETGQSMEDLEKKFSAHDIDTLIIISSSGKMHTDAFGIMLAEEYITDFKEFGHFNTKINFSPDVELIEKIRHAALDNNIGLTLTHNAELDYNFSVPLYFLTKDKKPKIIPFIHSFRSIKTHYELGRVIKKRLTETNKKIGILVSGNLSHRSSDKSPLGFSPMGKKFNDKFIELIETKNSAGFLSLDEKMVKEAKESVLLPTAILMGIIDKINYKPQIFSFEAPLGIAYLVCNFKIL